MDEQLTGRLPLARYRFHWTAITPVRFPDWAGSVLRGGFGHALRQLACMTRQTECKGCPLLLTCPYPAIFAPPRVEHALQRFSQPPAPYLFEPAGWGDRCVRVGETWHFDMVLLGRALHELPLIRAAWQRAAERGLGPGGGQSEIAAIDYLAPDGTNQRILHGPREAIDEHTILAPADVLPVGCEDPQAITLHFLTPLRLQDNGRVVPQGQLDAVRLLMSLVRRLSLLAEFHGSGAPGWDFTLLKQSAAKIDSQTELKWLDWTRYSSRQRQTMQLGGVTGRWTLQGDLAPFLPALHLGQWVHVGKETVFGLGRYTLE